MQLQLEDPMIRLLMLASSLSVATMIKSYQIRNKSEVIGIGVLIRRCNMVDGLAQRLYVNRGYIPDGHVTCNYKPTIPDHSYPLDDDLVLWFTKKLDSFED